MPSSLATSGTAAPAASFASAWRSLRTICSGECRLPIKSPPYAHLGLSDSHSNWTRFWGAGHVLDKHHDSFGDLLWLKQNRRDRLLALFGRHLGATSSGGRGVHPARADAVDADAQIGR